MNNLRLVIFAAIAGSFLMISAWWGILRNPCYSSHAYGVSAWGEGAWHSGLGTCAPKPWWRP